MTHEARQRGSGLPALVAGVVTLLVTIGLVAWWAGRPEPAAPVAGEDAAGETALTPARVVLAPVTSRAAILWLDGRRLGKLAVAADGRVQGDALLHAPARARRLGRARRVDLLCPPGLDRDVADAVQRLFVRSGASGAQVVEVDRIDPPQPGDPDAPGGATQDGAGGAYGPILLERP